MMVETIEHILEHNESTNTATSYLVRGLDLLAFRWLAVLPLE